MSPGRAISGPTHSSLSSPAGYSRTDHSGSFRKHYQAKLLSDLVNPANPANPMARRLNWGPVSSQAANDITARGEQLFLFQQLAIADLPSFLLLLFGI